MITTQPLVFTTSFLLEAPTGLAGTVTWKLVTAEGVVIVAPTTAGIVEVGPGQYARPFQAPATFGSYLIEWFDGSVTVGEDVVVGPFARDLRSPVDPSDDPPFALSPEADPSAVDPEAAVDAAVENVLAGGVPAAADPDPPVPIGKTWKFDFETGQFVRNNKSAVAVYGVLSLAVWAEMAIRTPRYGYAVFDDDFGMEHPEDPIGLVDPEIEISDYEGRMRNAVIIHDRISEVQVVDGEYDPSTGILTAGTLGIVTDEEEHVALTALALRRPS